MKVQKMTIIVYALIVLLGGCIAYLRVHSLASIFFGGSSGIALLLCGLFLEKNFKTFLYTAVGIIFCLDGFFSYRFMHSLKFFPSGMMSLLSLAALLILVMAIPQKKRQTP
jgi:uncharacterized membrane protein (UPF0136 family)